MRTTTISWLLGVVALGLSATGTAQQRPGPAGELARGGGQWVNTRLAFTFGDDNVLLDAGETKRSSPTAYFGNCDGSALDRDGSGLCTTNRTNLVIYKRLELSETFQPEAALSLRLGLAEGDLQDDGSYIRANGFFDKSHRTYWALTLFPADADRMRLGFYRDVSWGGTDAFPKNYRNGYAPGIRYDLDMEYWYLFFGAKGALVRAPGEDALDNAGNNTIQNVERTFYGALAGAGFEVMDTGLRFEFNGGFFQKGNNPRQNALGEPVWSGGASARISYRYGLPIGRQIDIRIYQQDPIRDELFAKETYQAGRFSMAVEGEATWLIQTLEDPDRAQSTKNEQSWMAHLGLALKVGYFRMHLHGIYRDLTAITYDSPGIIPYQALSDSVETTPEIFGSLSLDYNFQPYDITLGVAVGVLQPATYKGTAPFGDTASTTDLGIRKMVVRGSSPLDWDILPPGEDENPIVLARLDLKWSYYEAFGVIAQITYSWDNNLAQVVQNAQGYSAREFYQPHRLGFVLMTQVAF